MPELADAQSVHIGDRELLEVWCAVDGQPKLAWCNPKHFVVLKAGDLEKELQRRHSIFRFGIEKIYFDSVYFERSEIYAFQSFVDLEILPSIELGPKVTTLTGMFEECITLKSIPPINTQNITNMRSTFGDCRSLRTIPTLDCSSVTDASNIFQGCRSLESFVLQGIRTGFDAGDTKLSKAGAQKVLDALGNASLQNRVIVLPPTARGVNTSGATAKGWTIQQR